jgi:hypothetical protein
MHTRNIVGAFVVVASTASGCGNPLDESLTIVIDADRTRSEREKSELTALREAVQQDRARVEEARRNLQAVQEDFKKNLPSAAGLQRFDDALAQLTRPGGGPPAAARENSVVNFAPVLDELRKEMAAQEDRLRALVAASAAGRPPPPASTAFVRNEGNTQKSEASTAVLAALRARQLVISDVERGDAQLNAIRDAERRGDVNAANQNANALMDTITKVTIDRELVRKKYKACNDRLKNANASDAQKNVVVKQMSQVIEMIEQKRYADANAALMGLCG